MFLQCLLYKVFPRDSLVSATSEEPDRGAGRHVEMWVEIYQYLITVQ